MNIMVGDNEVGKSTLLEAINLALTGQLNGRSIQYDLHPFLFHQGEIADYVAALKAGAKPEPPYFQIELYLNNIDELAELKGTNNGAGQNVPGLLLRAELNSAFNAEYQQHVANPDQVSTLPVELYHVVWRSFADKDLSPRTRPLKTTMIDTGDLRYSSGPQRYVLDQVSGFLDPADRAQISLAYRRMKDTFHGDNNVTAINQKLAEKKGDISDKEISVSLDATSKGSWEAGIVTNLDGIPFTLVGKGEQSSVKIQLAMDAAANVKIFLIEEPENHLSFTGLSRLISKIGEKADERQVFVTTHSSFVLNKLDVGQVLLFNGESGISLNNLRPNTRDYFKKLPGHDTLRMILARKVILVEGPSDELVVQKAILQSYGQSHLDLGVDVISVRSLAFKRFLEISTLLSIPTRVLTDNDGNAGAVVLKYRDYNEIEFIEICYSENEALPSLEDQLVQAAGRLSVNEMLNKDFENDDDLIAHMKDHKTDSALAIYNSQQAITFPAYIENAIRELDN